MDCGFMRKPHTLQLGQTPDLADVIFDAVSYGPSNTPKPPSPQSALR